MQFAAQPSFYNWLSYAGHHDRQEVAGFFLAVLCLVVILFVYRGTMYAKKLKNIILKTFYDAVRIIFYALIILYVLVIFLENADSPHF